MPNKRKTNNMLIKKNLLNSLKIMDRHNFCLTTNLLHAEMVTTLLNCYPTKNFTKSIRNIGEKKHYILDILPIIETNKKTPEHANIPIIWQKFIAEITLPTYIETILQLANIVAPTYNINIGFYTFNNGGWVSPHIDNPGKIFTQIFYFNQFWDVTWGGKLNLLQSNNPDDIIFSIPPLSNYTATIFRGNNTWHMVEPVASSNNIQRLSLQLEVLEK